MKTMVFSVCALLLYSLCAVTMEQKMEKYTTPAVMLLFSAIMVPLMVLCLLYLKATGEVIVFPSGGIIVLALAIGAMYFTADTLYFRALATRGKLEMVTTIIALFPVCSSIIKYIWVGGLPNGYQIAAYFLATLSGYLAVKYSQ